MDENVVMESNEEPVLEPEQSTTFVGIVSDCKMLNVRAEPNAKARIITIIPVDAEVLIDLDESTDEFYKITSDHGVVGYCMAKYIRLA